MNAHIKRLFTVVLAVLLLPTTAAMSQVYIEPGTFGSPLWQGEVANEAALATCNGDTASTIHWLVSESALAYCPADGSDWEVNTFGGGGGGAGTVTSVAFVAPTGFTISGSPITTTGTFTLGLSTQAAGRVWAGPASGADAAPGFRLLVATDIPALSYLTGIDSEDLGDLANVSETGAGTGEALVNDGTGAWAPSASAVILEGDSRLSNARTPTAHATSHEDGGSDETAIEDLPTSCTIGQVVESDGAGGLACADAGGAVGFADVGAGTNANALVIGAGGSLKKASTGTIDASAIDADGDGTREIVCASGACLIDVDDDGSVDLRIGSIPADPYAMDDAAPVLGFGFRAATAGYVRADFGSSLAYLRDTYSFNWKDSTGADYGSVDLRVTRASAGRLLIDAGSGVGASVRIQQLATAPACSAEGDEGTQYVDTSGAKCECLDDGTGTGRAWVNMRPDAVGNCT